KRTRARCPRSGSTRRSSARARAVGLASPPSILRTLRPRSRSRAFSSDDRRHRLQPALPPREVRALHRPEGAEAGDGGERPRHPVIRPWTDSGRLDAWQPFAERARELARRFEMAHHERPVERARTEFALTILDDRPARSLLERDGVAADLSPLVL